MKERSKKGKDEEVNGQGGRGVPQPHTGQEMAESHPLTEFQVNYDQV